jgi:hypothetical protein
MLYFIFISVLKFVSEEGEKYIPSYGYGRMRLIPSVYRRV